MSFKVLGFALLIAVGSLAFESGAGARGSYLFGDSASDAFGPATMQGSPRYSQMAANKFRIGFVALNNDYGSDRPSALRILIKDDSIASALTQSYVDTLSTEKSTLMRIYHLSNTEYNKLAAIAFGVLGRETKFGKSLKYFWKETHQDEIWEMKLAKKKFGDYVSAVSTGDPWKFFAAKTWQVAPNSRGLTQIKAIPQSIVHDYCVNESQLNDPRITAIATVGFLAESLKILKNRVRNKQLLYVTNENLFDYVLYVYFGSMRQLVDPFIDYKTGMLVNDVATPDRNIYIQTVPHYIHSLAMFENQRSVLETRTDYACRIPGDN